MVCRRWKSIERARRPTIAEIVRLNAVGVDENHGSLVNNGMESDDTDEIRLQPFRAHREVVCSASTVLRQVLGIFGRDRDWNYFMIPMEMSKDTV